MMGINNAANSSNYANVKLVNILNNLGIAHIVVDFSHNLVHLLTCTVLEVIGIKHMQWVGNINYKCQNTLPLSIHVHK